jgi:hypothetical protein
MQGTMRMNVGELRRALEEAEGILSSAGAKAAGKDLRAFLQIFEGRDHEDINVFFDELRRRLSTITEPREDTPRVHDADRVDRYVAALNSAGTDKPAFTAVHAELKKDKVVSKEDVDTIAHRFTGGRTQWPSKSEALSAIQEWFDHKAYQAVKMIQVDKGTPWKAKRA